MDTVVIIPSLKCQCRRRLGTGAKDDGVDAHTLARELKRCRCQRLRGLATDGLHGEEVAKEEGVESAIIGASGGGHKRLLREDVLGLRI